MDPHSDHIEADKELNLFYSEPVMQNYGVGIGTSIGQSNKMAVNLLS